jgi:hypothetical protein
MSSRQLRKLQQQKELEEAARRAEETQQTEESEDEPIHRPTKSRASLFANLATLDDEGDADGERGAGEEDPLSEPEETLGATSKVKNPKKKKKAKKAKGKVVEEKNNSQDIDAALEEFSLQKPAVRAWHNSKPTLDPQYEKICELVRIQTQHLKVGNEMRNLFGRAALENHDDAGGPVGRGSRRQPRAQQQRVDLETALKGHHAPGKGLPEVTLRRNHFIQGKEDWPKGTTGGLTMELVDDQRQRDGTIEFRFVHNTIYQATQIYFKQLVDIGSPQNLVGFLTKNRKLSTLFLETQLTSTAYHISSLLQVSKIAKDQTDHALSSDLLERALFTFGRASLSLFNTNLAQGKARLDFRRPENRELWLAGYQYIKSLIMKGTYRTAFEWAKFLLSLDPEEDPYCMRFMLHHLALRAHEFKWLLAFGTFASDQEKLSKDKRIVQKAPYMMYHNTPSLALAALQLKGGAEARKLLAKSMQHLPWLFTRLFSELNLDSPRSIWGHQPRTDAENLFTSLYVQQSKDLWNTTEGTALLMEIAHTISKSSLQPIEPVSNQTMDIDVVRFTYLDNTPALMALVPGHLLHRSDNSDSDPIPPYHSTLSYEGQGWTPRGRIAGEGLGMDDPMMALGRLLFQRRIGGDVDGDEGRDFEHMIRNGVGGIGSDEDEENNVEGDNPPGMVARLLTYLRGMSRYPPEGENVEEDGDMDDTDTSDMPELVDFEHRFERRYEDVQGEDFQEPDLDTDDDIPELV